MTLRDLEWAVAVALRKAEPLCPVIWKVWKHSGRCGTTMYEINLASRAGEWFSTSYMLSVRELQEARENWPAYVDRTVQFMCGSLNKAIAQRTSQLDMP
jgi:hypothetical protein